MNISENSQQSAVVEKGKKSEELKKGHGLTQEKENDTFYPWYDISIHGTIGLQKWMEEADTQTSKKNRAAAPTKMKIWARSRVSRGIDVSLSIFLWS